MINDESFWNLSKDYLLSNSLARRCLMVDEVPANARARYEVKGNEGSIFINEKRAAVVVPPLNGGTEIIPPSFSVKKYNKDEFNSNDKQSIEKWFSEYIQKAIKEEEDLFIELLDKTVESRNDQLILSMPDFIVSEKGIEQCFRLIEQHDLVGCSLILHPSRLPEIMYWKDFAEFVHPVVLKESRLEKEIGSPFVGHLFTADLLISNSCPIDNFYLTSSKDCVGVYFYQEDSSKEKIRVGIGIVNDYAVSKLISPP